MTKPDLSKLHCYYIDPTQENTEDGFIPSIVIKGESGHWPMAGDPTKHQAPWRWGDYETACRCATEKNARLGITDDEVQNIILSSMFAPPA